MIPPSVKPAPALLTSSARVRTVWGAMALASTYRPPNPPWAPITLSATARAACGGHTERMTSDRPVRSSREAASVRPAAAARWAVAVPRPCGTHSTVWPCSTRQRPTAEPISPGCSRPIVVPGIVSSQRQWGGSFYRVYRATAD